MSEHVVESLRYIGTPNTLPFTAAGKFYLKYIL